MSKKIAKIYSEARIPLETVIPREVPFSVEIDVASVCNLKCKFCFHYDARKIKESKVAFGVMDFEFYQKLIKDLKQFPYKPNKLKLFEFGEPLLNPKIAEMIRFAKENAVADAIETVSNGTLLNPTLNRALIAAGLDRINISVESLSDEGYEDVAGVKISFNDYVNNIKDLYDHKENCFIYIKLIDMGNLTEEDRQFFYDTFSDICDAAFIENAVPIWPGTIAVTNEEAVGGAYGQPIYNKRVCPLLFTRMIVNYDGIVSLCCADWARTCALGDATKESLYDIWNGETLGRYQRLHLENRREEISLCNGCTTLSTSTIDDVDAHRELILKRMNKGKASTKKIVD